MGQVWFCSDLHIGHKAINNFSPYRLGFKPKDIDEHDEHIFHVLRSTISKRDTTFFLGDICFDIDKMKEFADIPGTKHLIFGNHDKFDLGVYLKHFNFVHGFRTYKEFWISHAPIHPQELRGRKNIHGHVHPNTIPDENYVNICPENLDGRVLVNLTDIRDGHVYID